LKGVVPGAAITPDENGVGLEKALQGYISWVKPYDDGRDGESAQLFVFCWKKLTNPIVCTYYGFDEYDFGCYDSYNSSQIWYTDLSVDSGRQWTWMLCNEPLGFWQTYVAFLPPLNFL
jgi:hypothetical protein